MLWTAYIAASAPASCPAQTSSEPAAFMTSCLLIIIPTFPDILLNTSPTPIGLKPGFLSTCMQLNFPKMHNHCYFIYLWYITYWRVLQLLRGDLMLLFQKMILCHPSLSSYAIGCIFFIGPCSNACWEVSFTSGYFNFNNRKVSSVRGGIPLLILLFDILRDPLTFPFCIWNLNFFDIFTISFGLSSDFSRSWIDFSSS